MFGWLARLFGKNDSDFILKKVVEVPVSSRNDGIQVHDGISVETDDPLMAQVVAECWNSGDMVVGSRDEDGNETIEHFPDDDADC